MRKNIEGYQNLSKEQFRDLFTAFSVPTLTSRLTSRFPLRLSLRLISRLPTRPAAVSTLDLRTKPTQRPRPTRVAKLRPVHTLLSIDEFETKDHYKPTEVGGAFDDKYTGCK